MMARRVATILPPLTFDEALEATSIHSVAGLLSTGTRLLAERPFRAPHHTISDVALVGGGQQPRPGEISLAHHGVLFLDEMPEFSRHVLEVLRQPVEEGSVRIARAARTAVFPARFMLIGAMNPCPCGFLDDPARSCRCSPPQIARYASRLSGPLRDRLDLTVRVAGVPPRELQDAQPGESSEVMRARVDRRARPADGARRPAERAAPGPRAPRARRQLDRGATALMARALARLSLSAQGLRPRPARLANDCRSGAEPSDRAAAPGRSPAVSRANEPCFCHFPLTAGCMVEFPVSRNRVGRAGGRRPRRAVASRRYSIVLADRSSGVVRRFTLPLGPTLATTVIALALPILIGLGARWSAQATLDDLTTTNARLTIENENYREATGQLASQIAALQAAVDEIGITAAVDPAASRAMERLPAGVKSRAMGGGVAGAVLGSASGRAMRHSRSCATSSAPSRTGSTRCERASNGGSSLADATPSIWPVAGLAHVFVRQPPRSVHRRQRLSSRPRHLGQPRR